MGGPQHGLAHPLMGTTTYPQMNLSAAGVMPTSTSMSLPGTAATVANGQAAGPHVQKQLDQALISRQSASPHHHARMAIAAQRTAGSNGLHDSTNGTNGIVSANQKASQWTIVDLGGMQITSVSPELFRYTFLTTLYLNHNNLRTLSPEIRKLVHLVVLDISGNKLTSIPPELGILTNLKELLMFDNELTVLPPELGFLYQLETLGIEGNPFNEPVLSIMQKDGTTGVITYLRDSCPAGPPPPEREWITLDDEVGEATNLTDTFTILCYNTLCDKYATPQAYAYTPSWVLNWDYRKELLLQEILVYNPDIVCLQEVEQSQYDEYFRDQLNQLGEYDSVFYPKSRARTMDDYSRRSVDGCATFFKNTKFTLIEQHLIEFQQIAMQRPELRKTQDVYNRVMVKDNIAVVTLLEEKETHARVVVANAHLHWDPNFMDVKLVQTAMLMEELDRIIQSCAALPARHPFQQHIAENPSRLPLIICGDFNSLPESGVYEFLSQGHIPQNHEDFGSYVYGTYTSEGLAHKMSLRSCYSHINLDFTNFTPTFKGVIDYVWYTTNSLCVAGLLGNVDKDYISKTQRRTIKFH
ncbi:Glucose-repressible alcohol dehydrogenase transcriptional effector [Quaeritorhiza haematococci]|nr:Glucose-repressible alcohol dehydrogenase transcriptional effector [Quaeritorhiza haematococci]